MQFDVKVYRLSEGINLMPVVCADAVAARTQAEQQGYAVLSVRPSASSAVRLRRTATFDVALFAQELLALLEAGIHRTAGQQHQERDRVVNNAEACAPSVAP